ncbi:MAG: glycosyltransferase [Planctomycetes bacterium]|nr:glycosyltransferase [Planctomycetota bacterium]
MRILFVLHTFPPESWGGTELHVQDIARALAPDHELRIFCRAGDPDRAQGELFTEVRDGLGIVRFNNLYEDYVGFESTYRHRAAHEAFIQVLEHFRPDVVHIHHLTGLSTTIIEAAKARGYPVVYSLHDFWTVCPRGQRLPHEGGLCELIDRDRCQNCLHHLWPGWLEERRPGEGHEEALDLWDAQTRAGFRLCDLILTPSRFHRERMIEDGHISPGKIRALGHGLVHERIPPRATVPGRVRTIGYIGSVIPTKGVDVLIRAFERLDHEDLDLEIWGEVRSWHEEAGYGAELRALAGPRVQFKGRYEPEALAEILTRLDILVVPSLWWETFSLTIREGMLAGIPVVASDLGAMREALQDVEAGLLFPVGDAEALSRCLDRLIRDPELRRRCASHRESVKTIERNAADYLKIYDEAIAIAEQRRNLIDVKPSSFPEQKPAQAGRGDDKKDIKVSIEKVGSGDVRVSSAVERGAQTRVSFVLDYGPSDEAAEVRLTVDFGSSAATRPVEPEARAQAPRPAATIPAEAEDSSARMVASLTPEAEARAREEALYKLDQDLFPEQVRKLDEMVAVTHLEEEERVPRSRRRPEPEAETETTDDRPGREPREPREYRGAAGDGGDRRPRRERGRRRREEGDERPPRAEGDDDYRRERGPRDQREDGERRPRAEGQDEYRRERGPRERREDDERRPRRDREPREGGRDERPRRRSETEDRRPRRDEGRGEAAPSARPTPPKAEPKPEPKPLCHQDGDFVWEGGGAWQLPESSEAPPKQKPERAPFHRTGSQPTVKPTQPPEGGFGDGI